MHFKQVPDSFCIVRMKSGLYREVELWHRKTRVYAKLPGGFVELLAFEGEGVFRTSNPNVRVTDFYAPLCEWVKDIGKRLRYTKDTSLKEVA